MGLTVTARDGLQSFKLCSFFALWLLTRGGWSSHDLPRNELLPWQTIAAFLSFMFSFAVFSCLLPHSLFLCDLTFVQFFSHILCGQSCECSSLLQLGRDTGWGGAFTEKEDRGTSKFPAQSSCCLVLCILYCTVLVYPKTVPFSSHSSLCLSGPRKSWDSGHILKIPPIIESLTK